MNFLDDVITYVRRLVKTQENASLKTDLIIDYINRFWLMDVAARMQLFDLKTTYRFQTQAGVNKYNIPLYTVNGYPSQEEPGQQEISYYPVYQGFMEPFRCNGLFGTFMTQTEPFYSAWPNYNQVSQQVGTGDGSTTTFNLQMPFTPALRGHVDTTGIVAAGSSVDPIVGTTVNANVTKTSIYSQVFIMSTSNVGAQISVQDSGQFLSSNVNLGLLTGDVTGSWSATSNVVDYEGGDIFVTFDTPPADQAPINVQCVYVQQGIPRSCLFYNNVITLMPPPSDLGYLIELDAYLTPAAYLSTTASLQFSYMAEYIARGAARKILADTGDWEQFDRYEPLFREQELLVWKRSQRQITATKAPTIYSSPLGQAWTNNVGQGF